MAEILGKSTLTAKGQATIPKRVREELKLRVGDLLVFLKEGNNIIVRKGEIKV